MIDAAVPDVAVDVMSNMACDLSKPFGEPVNITELNSTSGDYELWLSPDRLTAYFASVRAGGVGSNDLYYATRASTTSTFSAPQLIPNVNSTAYDNAPVLSPDGLTLYFGSQRTGGTGMNDIYVATRNNTAAAFGTPTALLNVNSVATTPHSTSAPTARSST